MYPVKLFLILILFNACRTSKVNDGVLLTTTFEGDSSFFNEVEKQYLTYYDLSGLILMSKELELNKKTPVIISQPTMFQLFSKYYIVYPGEQIIISLDENKEIVFSIEGNQQRNREFQFQNSFEKLDQRLRPAFPNRTKDYSLDSVLHFEQQVKASLPKYISNTTSLFDSLASIYQISSRYKTLSKAIMENYLYSSLHYVYYVYLDVLKQNNQYQQKQRELIPIFNNITDMSKINLGAYFYIESIAEGIMNTKIRRIETEKELIENMDTVNRYFNNFSRDFLLSKMMYKAINKDILIGKKTWQYYYSSCKDNTYQSIVTNLINQQNTSALKSKRKKDNRLIGLWKNKIYTLEEVIEEHKGKLILIDIWASWCGPCLQQIPNMKKLEQDFSDKKIHFLYLSMDRDLVQWKLKSADINLIEKDSYVFENFKNQSFLEKYKVESIPRYIMINQKGSVVNADAPAPDDPALKKMIEENL